MTDIDEQVAAFRDQLTDLSTIDKALAETEIADLFRRFASANADDSASGALFESAGANQHAPEYRDTIILSAISMYATYIATEVELHQIHLHLDRFHRLALACRVAGIALKGRDDV